MIMAVIPLMNEAENIASLLNFLATLPIDEIVPVLNGCTDESKEIITKHHYFSRCHLLEYTMALGIDVPRAIGAKYAQSKNARCVLFIDGDLKGQLWDCCYRLLKETANGNCDLALTNCYPYMGYRSKVAEEVLFYRERLNRTINVFTDLGLATPSHGPHCVSRRLLTTLPAECFAIPPLMMAQAVKAGLKIKVAAALDGQNWSSASRGDKHNQKIAETIIGDALQAENYFKHLPLSRKDNGKLYMGYHQRRRFDLIK